MPWGNSQLLPLGPLREPLTALRRADVVVIHHADLVNRPSYTILFILSLFSFIFASALGESLGMFASRLFAWELGPSLGICSWDESDKSLFFYYFLFFLKISQILFSVMKWVDIDSILVINGLLWKNVLPFTEVSVDVQGSFWFFRIQLLFFSTTVANNNSCWPFQKKKKKTQ